MGRIVLPDWQVEQLFGDPAPFVTADGGVKPGWPASILATVELPAPLPLSWDKTKLVKKIQVHKRLVPHFTKALGEIFALPEAWATIGDYGGCYNWRAQRRASSLSRHCWASAIDLDVADNPFGRNPKVHDAVVAAFARNGFVWGGYFAKRRVDGMHFEFNDITKL